VGAFHAGHDAHRLAPHLAAAHIAHGADGGADVLFPLVVLGEAEYVVEHAERPVAVGAEGAALGHAHLVLGDLGDLIALALDHVGELAKRGQPLLVVGRPVGGVEGAPGGGDGLVQVLQAGVGGVADHLLVSRIEDGILGAVLRGPQFAVDEELGVGIFDHRITCQEVGALGLKGAGGCRRPPPGYVR
jgi:hypothetical protein